MADYIYLYEQLFGGIEVWEFLIWNMSLVEANIWTVGVC